MFIVTLLLVFASSFYTASCFSCGDVSQENHCIQLEGCSWNSTNSICEGTFNPLCVPPSCYYIDNFTQSATPAGTPADPLATLTDGLIKLANSSGSLIIMNHRNNTSVDMVSVTTISTNIIIKPLINGSHFDISFSKMSLPGLTIFTVSGQLTIIEANFNYSTTYCYLFFLTNGTVYLKGVNMQVSTWNSYSVICIPKFSSSKFYYEGGQISTKTATIGQFISGFGFFKNVKFMSITGLIAATFSATLIFEDCYFRGASGILFQVDKGANFIMNGCVVDQGNYSLIWKYANANITIQRTIFRGLINDYTINLLKYIPDTGFNSLPLTIRDCLFENITTKSVIKAAQMNAVVSLINVTMNNIRRIPDPYNASTVIFNPGLDASLGACCLIKTNSTLNVISSKFTNINSTCIRLDRSRLNIDSSVFDNSGIGIEKSSLAVDSLQSLRNDSGLVWILATEPSDPISINSSKFIKNTMLSMQGGAIRLTGSKQVQLSLTSNEFIENIAYYGGAVYIDSPLLLLNSTKNIFTNNCAFEGGAIYKTSYSLLKKPFLSSFIIEDNNYTGNTAIRAGGAVYANGDSLQISQGRFADNTARLGGGLYAINIDSQNNDTRLPLSGVTFINNIASYFGSGLFALSSLKEDQCIFKNNTDPLNQPIISQRPFCFLFSFYDVIIDKQVESYDDLSSWITNTSRTKLAFTLNTSQSPSNPLEIKHKSGTEIKQILKIEAYDEYGQILSFAEEDDQILIKITEVQNNISNFQAYLKSSPLVLSFNKGQIFVKTLLKIFGETNSQATLNFKGINSANNILYKANFIMDQNIQISFIPCEVGDFYDASSKSCNSCPSGTYSLTDPYQSPVCRACVDNAVCLGGSKIAPLPGYWRYDTETAVIMQCADETACRGGYVDEIYYPQGVCAPFHEGKLCYNCASNYAKFGSSEICFDCRGIQYYLKLFGFFGLYVIGIMLNFNYASSKKDKVSSETLQGKVVSERPLTNEELRFSILKIVISFIQMSSIIVQYKFGWPKQASEVIQITNKIMPAGLDAFSIDCFIAHMLESNAQTHFIKLIVAAVRPFIVWIILISCYDIYKALKERNPTKLRLSVGTNRLALFLILTFVDQPHIILIALETFKCQIYETSQGSVSFMVKDSQVECWTSIHIEWSAIAGVIFLIWGIILPILLLRKIQQIHKIDKEFRSEDYFKYRYIIGSMKPRWYYWELISLLRKSLVIIVFVCQPLLSDLTQITLILMILWCFAGICRSVKSYRDERLNKLELASLITLTVMTYTGAYFIDDKDNDTNKWNILIIVMLLTNIAFYLVSAYYFVASYLQKPLSKIDKPSPEVETKQEIQDEKQSFISIRSPAPSLEGQAIEDILQSIESEFDEYEKGKLRKQESPKAFFALNSISSEPDVDSEEKKTDNCKTMQSVLNLKDLEPMSRRESEHDPLQTVHHSTILSHRSTTTPSGKNKVYENQSRPKRFNLFEHLQTVQDSNPLTQGANKFSIPTEHEGVMTPQYKVKTKKDLSGDQAASPSNS